MTVVVISENAGPRSWRFTLPPTADAEHRSQWIYEHTLYAASTRRKPFHIAVAVPEVNTGKIRMS